MPSPADWDSAPDQPDDDEVAGPAEPPEVSSDSLREVASLKPRVRALPLFALPGTVLYPSVSLTFHIFEERYKAMVSDLLDEDRALAVALEETEDAGPREICGVGVITHVEDLDDGEKNIVITGSHRARIEDLLENRPYPTAKISPLLPPPAGAGLDQLAAEVRQLALEWIFFQDSEATQQLIQRIMLVSTPGYLADFVAHHLFEDVALKQEILETVDEGRRLTRVQGVIASALERLKVEKDV